MELQNKVHRSLRYFLIFYIVFIGSVLRYLFGLAMGILVRLCPQEGKGN